MNDHNGKYTRLRITTTGALAALAALAAIAGTTALAANPHGHAAMANDSTKAAPAAPVKHNPPQQDANNPNNPFLIAIQQLVNDGTITTTEGQAVDREILAGTVDTNTLAPSGLTPTQLQAVEQTLNNTKLAQAPPPQNAKGPRS